MEADHAGGRPIRPFFADDAAIGLVALWALVCADAPTAMETGLAALVAGETEASSALPSAELRATLGHPDYDAHARRFIVGE